MGYSGKTNKEKRNIEEAFQEAYNVLQVAVQMTEIVAEERNRLKDPLLRNLDIKVGMNTGKLIGCIIGTKVARYDIFGQDVLIARLIQRDCPVGSVRASEQFRRMMARKSFIYDTFYWQEIDEVVLPALEIRMKTHICEQIFAENETSEEQEEGQFLANGAAAKLSRGQIRDMQQMQTVGKDGVVDANRRVMDSERGSTDSKAGIEF
mmetsp:Transcript_4085/g.5006  ORF Transcript_4085/g.5006 Transcript_4085/m.5006 type:complete len:207 (-) Transcript_4085:73-693(-)|eukprot:CAMPEP_0170473562 /NCGR_PEP_ID=MMETSP0123-20130129/15464_1 /TAXON_ID=182087 /ORGANISM="Favella ehrenbergii, Strain Fehren 1" /LENGTH=206 /DNA_ID=CAMNT_0010742699 /DNA_START=197 /DNA_END=817 /DNA_ORIENTATION=-